MKNDEENVQKPKEKSNLLKASTQSIGKIMTTRQKTNGKLTTALSPIIKWGILGVLIIVILIGIAMFFITIPGMAMDKLKDYARKLAKEWIGVVDGKDSTKDIDEKTVYTALDYLNEMGYDIKGFGFLTDYVAGTSDGVKKDKNGKITEANSDFLTTYLASDNYVYTIKNHNLSANKWDTFWNNVGGFFGGAFSEKLTRGLIAVYNEGNDLGKRGGFYQDAGLFNADQMKLDVNSRKMTLQRGSSNAMSYDLDGWTGRYGMPLDFLLAVHIATMMPDLAYDMANTFETEIVLLLHNVNQSSVTSAFQNADGNYLTYSDFNKLAQAQNGIGEQIASAFGSVGFNDQEAADAMVQLNITQDPNSTMSAKDFLNQILTHLKGANIDNFYYYYPYIESVRNHWYRDVYYILNESNTQGIVKYDYDYESVTKERWTLYKTYTQAENKEKAGEYKLYALDAEGNYATSKDQIENYSSDMFEQEGNYFLFKGSASTQKSILQGKNEAGTRYNVAKMPEVITKLDDDDLKDLGWSKVNGIWMAYDTAGKDLEKWVRLYPNSTDSIESKLYTKMVTVQSVKQTGEGQRGPTNPTIKKMFMENTYFRYDGTAQVAEIITALRNKIKDDEIEASGDVYGPLNALTKEVKGSKKQYVDVTNKEYKAKELGFTVADGEVEKTYRVSDYSGKVSINQDSLNAFSMLENTHTLDSDYIYRDFKELVVELRIF